MVETWCGWFPQQREASVIDSTIDVEGILLCSLCMQEVSAPTRSKSIVLLKDSRMCELKHHNVTGLEPMLHW